MTSNGSRLQTPHILISCSTGVLWGLFLCSWQMVQAEPVGKVSRPSIGDAELGFEDSTMELSNNGPQSVGFSRGIYQTSPVAKEASYLLQLRPYHHRAPDVPIRAQRRKVFVAKVQSPHQTHLRSDRHGLLTFESRITTPPRDPAASSKTVVAIERESGPSAPPPPLQVPSFSLDVMQAVVRDDRQAIEQGFDHLDLLQPAAISHSPLSLCLRLGHNETAHLLIRAYVKRSSDQLLLTQTNSHGRTHLAQALAYGRLLPARQIIDRIVYVGPKEALMCTQSLLNLDEYGWNTLHYAAAFSPLSLLAQLMTLVGSDTWEQATGKSSIRFRAEQGMHSRIFPPEQTIDLLLRSRGVPELTRTVLRSAAELSRVLENLDLDALQQFEPLLLLLPPAFLSSFLKNLMIRSERYQSARQILQSSAHLESLAVILIPLFPGP